MKRKINIIGIGLGNPGHLTMDAINAMREVHFFLIPDKGDIKEELVHARMMVCNSVLKSGSCRFITVPDPIRGDDSKRGTADYRAAVEQWRKTRTDNYVTIINGIPQNAVIGFLVWGDPAFYDSIIGIVNDIDNVIECEIKVIPGISAIQALAAANMITLNNIASPIHITTGRRLIREWSADLGTVIVMLDKNLACRELADKTDELEIIWGAYLGLPYQVLVRGSLDSTISGLIELRRTLRAEHGWIMDTYILRPNTAQDDAPPLEI